MRPAGRRLPARGLEDALCRFSNSRHQFYLTNTQNKQVLGASVGWGLCEYPPCVILLSQWKKPRHSEGLCPRSLRERPVYAALLAPSMVLLFPYEPPGLLLICLLFSFK